MARGRDAAAATGRGWSGNPRLVVTENDTGRVISHGDTVTDCGGRQGTFGSVSSRGRTGTWKVTVDDREYYHSVWNLTVTEVCEE